MQKAYWRSLDHQSASTKSLDKKSLTLKQIQQEVQSKVEENKNLRRMGHQVAKHHLEFTFDDSGVLLDAAKLLMTFIDRNSAGVGDTQKTMVFIDNFIPVFFGMDRETFHAYMEAMSNENSPVEEMDDESVTPEEPSTPQSRKGANRKRMDLLREVLERRGEKANHGDKEGSAPASRDGTPDAVLVPSMPEPSESEYTEEPKWMEHPGQGNFNMQREYTLNEAYPKNVHHLYANLNIYCFLRSFEVLYSRLLRIKQHEKDAHEDVRRGLAPKPADELGIVDKHPTDFFYDCDPNANLYEQVMRMCREVVKGDLEMSHLEETLRRFYLRSGHLLYHLEKMLAFIAKFAGAIFSGDTKDRSLDIMSLFLKEREKVETTHNQEMQYRKQVERWVKDGDIYRVTYVSPLGQLGPHSSNVDHTQIPENSKITVRLMTPEDATLDKEELSEEARWSYYVSAYTMRDPTEGVPFSQMHIPFLKRNLPSKLEKKDQYKRYYRRLVHHDGLIIRICAKSYHILYEPGSNEWWWRPTAPPEEVAEETTKEEAAVKERRRDRFMEKFVNNPTWAHGLSKDQVDESNQRFRSWIQGSTVTGGNEPAGADADTTEETGPSKEEDTEMTDAKPNEPEKNDQ